MATQKEEKDKSRFSGLTSGDVVKLIYALEGEKLSFNQLYYYEKTGMIVPSIRSSVGKGIPRLYSVDDFILLRWLVQLNQNGINPNQFRKILKFLKKKMPEILENPENWVLITDGDSVKFADKLSDKILDIIDNSAQYLFVFPLGRIAGESRRYINKTSTE